jgi:hypothetical protein
MLMVIDQLGQGAVIGCQRLAGLPVQGHVKRLAGGNHGAAEIVAQQVDLMAEIYLARHRGSGDLCSIKNTFERVIEAIQVEGFDQEER